MNIYLIDNNKPKRECLPEILRQLNAGEGSQSSFRDGFVACGGAEQALDDAHALRRAAEDRREGVCLIDCSMPGMGTIVNSILDYLADEVQKGNELYSGLCSEWNTLAKSGKVLAAYQLGLLLTMICIKNGTRVLTISTAGSIEGVKQFEDLGVLNCPYFPDQASPQNVVAQLVRMIRSLGDIVSNFREATRGWFLPGIGVSDRPARPLHDFDPGRKEEHKEIVKGVWHWIPDSWCKEAESANRLHSTLKSTCGESVRWMSEAGGKRPLSIGGAYLLLLMTLENHFDGWVKRHSESVSDVFTKSNAEKLSNPLFPMQPQEAAHIGVRSLVAFYEEVVRTKGTAEEAIKRISFVPGFAGFKVELRWDATRAPANASESPSLASVGQEVFGELASGREEIALPERAKLIRRFLDLLSALQISEDGVGSAGTVFIRGRTLLVGSLGC